MAQTYTPINSTTLTASSSSISFSSIPSTYTDLVLIIAGAPTGYTGAYSLRFNSDSGSNYSGTGMYGNGSSAGSYRQTNATKAYLGDGANSSQLLNIISIQNYSNTTTYKTFINKKAQTTSSSVEATVDLWRSTAAINAITILPDSNAFDVGTVFSLYGIKAA